VRAVADQHAVLGARAQRTLRGADSSALRTRFHSACTEAIGVAGDLGRLGS
jgi:hypothetical protein